MDIDYDKWAEALLEEIYYCPENQRATLVCDHLQKAFKRGYKDGLENGWAYEQDLHWALGENE